MARCRMRAMAGGDATGHAQRVPLAKIVRYYRTHLAISAKRHVSTPEAIMLRHDEHDVKP